MSVRKLLHCVRNCALEKFGTAVLLRTTSKKESGESLLLGDAETIERRVIAAFFFLRYGGRQCSVLYAARYRTAPHRSSVVQIDPTDRLCDRVTWSTGHAWLSLV
jgi:hypothetical protein